MKGFVIAACTSLNCASLRRKEEEEELGLSCFGALSGCVAAGVAESGKVGLEWRPWRSDDPGLAGAHGDWALGCEAGFRARLATGLEHRVGANCE